MADSRVVTAPLLPFPGILSPVRAELVGWGGEKQLRGRPKALIGTAPEGWQSLRVWGGAVVSI